MSETWKPQPGPQEKAIRAAFIEELFFGGARGGGKTSFLMGDFASEIQEFGNAWRGIIFRRTYPELDEVVEEGKRVLYKAFPGAEYKVGVHEFRIPHATGDVVLRLRHMENVGDADHYMGHQYSWIGFDELPNWPNLQAYKKLKACLRSTAGIQRMRIRSTGNPGGVGHQAVKEYFIDPAPDGEEIIKDEQSQTPRMFIKSLVTDNQILLKADPGYIDRLKGVGDEHLVKAWLEGDWDSFVGQYFTAWNSSCIIPSFPIPSNWPLFGGLDYGEAKPTSFGLYTIDFDGNVYRIGEYYLAGASASTHAYEIDKMIQACPFTGGRPPSQIYADPSMWAKRHLTEVVNHSPYDIFREQGLHLTKANNDRITGWRVINDALTKENFYVFGGWNDNLIRTLPSLPRSTSNPEDLDTHSEDHAADELRYAMMHVYKPSLPKLDAVRNPFYGGNVLGSLKARKRA